MAFFVPRSFRQVHVRDPPGKDPEPRIPKGAMTMGIGSFDHGTHVGMICVKVRGQDGFPMGVTLYQKRVR